MNHFTHLPFQSVIAFAFMLVWIVGGFLAYLVLDGTFYLIGGPAWTGSHAVYELGLQYKWLPYVFVIGCFCLTIFWAHHFWG